MKNSFLRVLSLIFIIALCSCNQQPAEEIKSDQTAVDESDKLVILWTSRDREVALNMIFMYSNYQKRNGYWDDITIVVWGPSQKLLSEDKELQENVKQLLSIGVTVKACKACSDKYGVSKQLADLGVTVKYMSEFTEYIKGGRNVLAL